MTLLPTRRAIILGVTAVPLNAAAGLAQITTEKRTCLPTDIITINMQATDSPRLVLEMPRQGISSVLNERNEGYNLFSHDCSKVLTGNYAIISAKRTQEDPNSSQWLCDQIRLYAITEKQLNEYYSQLLQQPFREAFRKGEYEKSGDWYYVLNRRAAFYDPTKLSFGHDIWLTYDGTVLAALYKEHFYLTNWIIARKLSGELDDGHLQFLFEVYQSSVKFMDKYSHLEI